MGKILMDKVIESFITVCDDMMIVNEGLFTKYKEKKQERKELKAEDGALKDASNKEVAIAGYKYNAAIELARNYAKMFEFDSSLKTLSTLVNLLNEIGGSNNKYTKSTIAALMEAVVKIQKEITLAKVNKESAIKVMELDYEYAMQLDGETINTLAAEKRRQENAARVKAYYDNLNNMMNN